jgi:trans-aconitate 2-methyltransferase
MLEEARKRLPDAHFAPADASVWTPEPSTDLVFANAIYQWVPEHLAALPKVLAAMGEGGCLAVQMPDNMAEPSHALMREVAVEGPWADRLAGAARLPLPPVTTYYNALKPFARHVDIWHIVYNHALANAAAVVEWVKATGLKPFLEPLTTDEQTEFLARYLAKITDAYPAAVDGKVLLRFPRLFIVAVR